MLTVLPIEVFGIEPKQIELIDLHAGGDHMVKIGDALIFTIDRACAKRLSSLLASAFPEEEPL